MNIEITKRNSKPLDILNSNGDKLDYSPVPQKDIIIKAIPSISKDVKKETQNKVESKPILQQQSPIMHSQSTNSTVSSVKQSYNKKSKNEVRQSKSATPPPPPSNGKNSKFHYQPKSQTLSSNHKTGNEQPKKEDQANKKKKSQKDKNSAKSKKMEQIQYIDSVQKLIDIIMHKPPEKMVEKFKSKFDTLNRMIQSLVTLDDKLLNKSKIFISYMNLFLHKVIVNNAELDHFYSIFFIGDNFIIGHKILYFFDASVEQASNKTIINFIDRLALIFPEKQNNMLNYLNGIINSNEIKLSDQTKEAIDCEIDRIEKEIIKNTNRAKFVFKESTIFQSIDDSELINKYKEPWSSISSYIKVMYNLAIENFFYPLRVHLNELKNDELDPRDLFLYEKVKIHPCYVFDDRSEYDVFIKFSIRAPNYKDGNTVKPRKMRTIDWSFTERLSKNKLLFFSFSPFLEKIEAVAVSCANKGTIQNDIVPISFLQGTLDIEEEYFMFEPIDHWNGPLFDNILNTNEITLPKRLIKPIISLDFSENTMKNDLLICIPQLLRNKSDYIFRRRIINTPNADVNYYCKEIISDLERSTDKKNFIRYIMSDLCTLLKKIEMTRKQDESPNQSPLKTFDRKSEVAKTVLTEIKRYIGFKSVDEEWPFGGFTEEEFRTKCTVDHEQYKALKFSLDHRLTLVNGAPGTGKTYLACELVKLLLNSYYEYPIIVVTYKNVSLDGFLDNIANFLDKNEVDFIRIGGRPRTENKFILSMKLDQEYPPEVQELKSRIIYLDSLAVMMNDSLKELENKALNEISKTIIIEIDKAINIKKTLFDMFPIFSKQEETLIIELFNPKDFIPPVGTYFNCWAQGNEYYEQIKAQYKELLQSQIDKLFDELLTYLNKKEEEENTEYIKSFINKRFHDNEIEFSRFVAINRRLILARNQSALFNIIELTVDLGSFISPESNGLIPDRIKDAMNEKMNAVLTSTDKKESLKIFLKEMKEMNVKYSKGLKEYNSAKIKEYEKTETKRLGYLLSKKRLIAMTATRAAQYKACLDLSGARFMIVEEAGELTESMAFSIIPKSIQNLVMIGDYRQLRPTVEHKLTFQPYNHHISLFEKEVIHAKSIKADNLFTLSIQRRMYPQIASLLRQVFYNNNKDEEKLNDDESTEKLEKPLGFPNHIQFWLHDFEEKGEDIKMRSHVNVNEAKVCAHLFLMMLCRGYKSSEITIIALYKGQKKQIERELMNLIDRYYSDPELNVYDAFDFENDLPDLEYNRDLNELIDLRKSLVGRYVKCLDDFQGEENEVIIISLTRSQKPGFVKNENRALVTLSRARQIEFVVGNRNVFGPENKINKLWRNITTAALINNDNVVHYDGLEACPCPIHSENQKLVLMKNIDDFINFRFNCCLEDCSETASCGHHCFMPCHFHSDLSSKHKNIFERRYFCNERCAKRCKKGHQCEEMCGTCVHYGCPPCSHQCDGRCSFCDKPCCMICCHDDLCQCQITEICSICENEFTEYHGNLNFIGNNPVCKRCYENYMKNQRRRYFRI